MKFLTNRKLEVAGIIIALGFSLQGEAAFAGCEGHPNCDAPVIACTSNAGERGHLTVDLEAAQNGLYTIGYFGGSRNTYKATYQDVSPTWTLKGRKLFRIPSDRKLQKVDDQSTWKDMPEELLLGIDGLMTIAAPVLQYKLTGLIPDEVVYFYAADCSQN